MQEHRKVLVGLLRKASEIISHEGMSTEVNTVAEALHQASEDKFSSLVDADKLSKFANVEAVKEAELPKEQHPDGDGPQGFQGDTPDNTGASLLPGQIPVISESIKSDMKSKSDGPVNTMKSAAEAAGKWSAKASELIRRKLAAEIAARPDAIAESALSKEQTPDGHAKSEGTVKDTPDNTGAALTKEQSPEDASTINSDMVAKSKSPVDTMESKEAADKKPEEEEKEAAAKKPEEGEKEAAAKNPEEEEKEAAAKNPEEEEKEAATKNPEEEEEKLSPKKASYTFAGVQMSTESSLDPVEPDSSLDDLFR